MRTDINADSQKDPDQLERELDEQRAHIASTLRALERKFSPGQIFDQVLGYTRSNGGDFSRNLVDTVKNNPIPTLLTATGLAWMMIGQKRPQSEFDEDYYPANASYGVETSVQPGGDGKTAALKSKAGELRQGAAHSMDRAKLRMQQFGGSAESARQNMRQQAQSAKQAMRHQAQRANQGFDYLLKEQPLALGAIGVALGALIGASLPRTHREDQLLGESRDKLADKAAQAAGEGYEKAQELGSRIAEDAKQEIHSSSQSAQSAMQSSTSSSQTSGSPRYN